MTLAFSQILNGKPTYFCEKILRGLEVYKNISSVECSKYFTVLCSKTKYENLLPDFIVPIQKIHTIRQDEKNKWKAGNLIHFVINNRTKNRFQFAPVVKCVSTQNFYIHWFYSVKTQKFDSPCVWVDHKIIRGEKLLQLAQNDGFDTVEDFFKYFNTNFTGKLIHWTNTKY